MCGGRVTTDGDVKQGIVFSSRTLHKIAFVDRYACGHCGHTDHFDGSNIGCFRTKGRVNRFLHVHLIQDIMLATVSGKDTLVNQWINNIAHHYLDQRLYW